MELPFAAIVRVPVGAMAVGILLSPDKKYLQAIDILWNCDQERDPSEPAAQEVVSQLKMYLTHPAQRIDFNTAYRGSVFQERVWVALREIPTGEVRTYGQLAAQLGSSARAVGSACRANPFPIAVPCHRVVSAHDMGGYCGHRDGDALRFKEWLLAHERPSLDG
jgi:methylated-DNA-[protein]-cysteine S-methyltransferase